MMSLCFVQPECFPTVCPRMWPIYGGMPVCLSAIRTIEFFAEKKSPPRVVAQVLGRRSRQKAIPATDRENTKYARRKIVLYRTAIEKRACSNNSNAAKAIREGGALHSINPATHRGTSCLVQRAPEVANALGTQRRGSLRLSPPARCSEHMNLEESDERLRFA